MSSCCVSGCSNRGKSAGKLKFYRLPSARQPCNADRRRLWLQAIQHVNGNTEELDRNVRVCSAHFISGEESMDYDNPDFVPSVFNWTKQKPKRKAKSYMGRRKRKHRGAKAKTGDTATHPRAGSPADLQSEELTEETETPLPEPKEEETLTKDAEAGAETNASTPQTPLSPNKAVPSSGAPAGILALDNKFPVLLLKPVLTPAQEYRCQLCDENFPDVSQLLKHEKQHQGKTQDGENCEQPLTSQADFKEPQQVQEPSFPCNICDRSFTSSHHLKRHKLLHVKDGRKCHTCGVLFCQRHNHVLYLPQTETLVEFEEESSTMEPENSPSESQESNLIPEPNENTESTMTATVQPTTSPQILPSSSTYSRPLSKTRNPLPPASHTNIMTKIPLPVFRKPSCPLSLLTRYSKSTRTPTELKHILPYDSSAIGPPQDIELPPSLQMFSPKTLTSPFFEVTRNYDYILSKQKVVKKKTKEVHWEVPLISPEGQSIETEREEHLPYLDVVF